MSLCAHDSVMLIISGSISAIMKSRSLHLFNMLLVDLAGPGQWVSVYLLLLLRNHSRKHHSRKHDIIRSYCTLTAVSFKMAAFTAWVEYVDTSTVLIFLAMFLCALWLLSSSYGPTNWPPGPKGWPIIGNADLFWNNDQLYLSFEELAKKYGEMFHLRIGKRHMVVLTGQEVIREAFVEKGEYFSNRPTFTPLVKYTHNGKG